MYLKVNLVDKTDGLWTTKKKRLLTLQHRYNVQVKKKSSKWCEFHQPQPTNIRILLDSYFALSRIWCRSCSKVVHCVRSDASHMNKTIWKHEQPHLRVARYSGISTRALCPPDFKKKKKKKKFCKAIKYFTSLVLNYISSSVNLKII